MFLPLLRKFSGSSSCDTIYALSTGWGKSAIAVVRISGPDSTSALSLLKAPNKINPLPILKQRRAYLRTLYFDKKPIDEGIVLFFKGPRSYTG